jgi:hypothetical protein
VRFLRHYSKGEGDYLLIQEKIFEGMDLDQIFKTDTCFQPPAGTKARCSGKKYDAQFKVVFDAIRELMTPPEPNKRKIGFLVKERAARYGRA